MIAFFLQQTNPNAETINALKDFLQAADAIKLLLFAIIVIGMAALVYFLRRSSGTPKNWGDAFVALRDMKKVNAGQTKKLENLELRQAEDYNTLRNLMIRVPAQVNDEVAPLKAEIEKIKTTVYEIRAADPVSELKTYMNDLAVKIQLDVLDIIASQTIYRTGAIQFVFPPESDPRWRLYLVHIKIPGHYIRFFKLPAYDDEMLVGHTEQPSSMLWLITDTIIDGWYPARQPEFQGTKPPLLYGWIDSRRIVFHEIGDRDS